MKRDLIVFGEDWGGLPSSTQHLIKRLMPNYRVIWINSIGLRQPRICWRDLKRACIKLLSLFKSSPKTMVSEEGSSPLILKPITIPAPAHPVTRKLACWLLKLQLKPVFTRLGIDQPVVWTSLPTAVDFCDTLKPEHLIYYCGDDFSALAGVDHQTVARHEARLIEHADLILAASPTLASRFPSHKTQLLPHGVDLSLFTSPASRADDLPHDGKPVAGFYGSLSSWLDYDLLYRVASHMPDWHFVFIGKQECDIGAIRSLPNVHLLGPKPHAELSRYSQHWQVSLLPFRDTPQIRACNPLKLLEYLAAGQPVLSTCFPAAQAMSAQLHLVRDTGEMIRTLQLLRHPEQQPKPDLNNHSWDARAAQLKVMMERL